jgi:hypothetical protein
LYSDALFSRLAEPRTEEKNSMITIYHSLFIDSVGFRIPEAQEGWLEVSSALVSYCTQREEGRGGGRGGIVGLCEKGRGGDLIEFQTARGKVYPG